MSVHEISVLRKSKDFEAAFNMAKEELEADPHNEWSQMAMFWVLRDKCLYQYLPNNQKDKIQKALSIMQVLIPTMKDEEGFGLRAFESLKRQVQPESNIIENAATISKSDAVQGYELVKNFVISSEEIDSSFHEQLGWILFRYIREMIGKLSSIEIRRLLSYYMKLGNKRPSTLHSQILRLALKFSQNNADFNFYKFLLLWNPQQLNQADFKPTTFNGHEIKPFINYIFNQLIDGHYVISIDELSESFNLKKENIIEYLRESSFWNLWALWKDNKKKEFFDAILNYCKHYAQYGPSHWHSEILKKALHSFVEQDEDKFIYFFEKWDFNNLRNDDWITSLDQKGNTYPSTAESAAKKCFNCVKNMPTKNESILTWLSDFFDIVGNHLENNEWIIRNRAIIYLWENNKDEAIKYYKNVLLKLSDKFYIWSELSKCVEDKNLKIGLLSKALLLEHNESFLGEVHLNIASLLIDEKLYSNAMYELNCYREKREAEGWNVSRNYDTLLQTIPIGTQPTRNNISLYNQYSEYANDFAFSSVPSEKFVFIERWEKEGKKRCTLVNNDGINIQVNEKRFTELKKSQVGKIFDVKYHKQEEEGRRKFIPLIIKKSEEQNLSAILPMEYGYVSYINKDKKVAHINSQSDSLLFYPINDASHKIYKGDFVCFNVYSSSTHHGSRNYILNLNVCDAKTALEHFRKRIVVVDNINNEKQIIHYQAGPKLIDGIIFFDQTSIRPNIGDLLEITYYNVKDKSEHFKRNVLDVSQTENSNQLLRKTISGRLMLKYKDHNTEPDFAFIGDYYVHKSLLIKYKIETDCDVTAQVIYAGKEQWKTTSIETI